MTEEDKYKRKIMLALMPYGFEFQAHEDMYSKHIPDLSFAAHGSDGWIEVKFCKDPPPTLGSIKHYTKGQEKWLADIGKAGSGHCFLLLGTKNSNTLWRWDNLKAARDVGFVYATSLASIHEECVASFAKEFDLLFKK